MFKLMKYEFRRQLFSKVLMLGGLLALVAAFLIFCGREAKNSATLMLSLMAFATLVIMLYAPFEWSFIYEKDINTKQGYMLFLTPKKATAIITAKLLVALLQSIVIYAVYFTVIPFCERIFANKFGGAEEGFISEMLNGIFSELPGVKGMVSFGCLLLLLWLFLCTLGFLVGVIPGQGKVTVALGAVGYIVAIFAVFFLMDKVVDLFEVLNAPSLVSDIFEWVYMIGIDAALFFGSARLMEKKVSI